MTVWQYNGSGSANLVAEPETHAVCYRFMFYSCICVYMHAILQQPHSCCSPQIKRGLLVPFLGNLPLGLPQAVSQRLPCLQWSRCIAGDAWTCVLSKMYRDGESHLAGIKFNDNPLSQGCLLRNWIPILRHKDRDIMFLGHPSEEVIR